MSRRVVLILAGMTATIVTGVVAGFLLASANLGLTGFLPGIVRLFPAMISLGIIIGLSASYSRLHGCLVMINASAAFLVGMLAIAVLHDSIRNELLGYLAGLGIGVIAGWIILLALSIAQQIWIRIEHWSMRS